MSFAGTLSPPIDPTIEQETVTFDFAPALSPGVTIVSIDEIISTAIIGSDPSAAACMIGSGTVIPSPSTSAPRTAVAILYGSCVAGVTYQIQCVVITSDGQTLSVRVNFPCATPPNLPA